MHRVLVRVGLAIAMLVLAGVAVWPQLSARAVGEEYRVRVAPVDPVDPFRGAYVELSYPDLGGAVTGGLDSQIPGEPGTIYLPLHQDGDLWRAGEATRTRPGSGPYLSCDDGDFRIRCGIESWFLPQAKARELEQAVVAGGAVATIRVDGRGNASLVTVEPR